MSETKERPVMAAVKNMNEARNKQIITFLEEYLKLAKEGHLSDVALIGKVRGAPITEFLWDTDNPLEIVGALEMAKVEIISDTLAEADEEDDEDDGD